MLGEADGASVVSTQVWQSLASEQW
jgi:hypothetical protein